MNTKAPCLKPRLQLTLISTPHRRLQVTNVWLSNVTRYIWHVQPGVLQVHPESAWFFQSRGTADNKWSIAQLYACVCVCVSMLRTRNKTHKNWQLKYVSIVCSRSAKTLGLMGCKPKALWKYYELKLVWIQTKCQGHWNTLGWYSSTNCDRPQRNISKH